MKEKLFYRESGEGQPLLILHGVFGSSDNWMTIGRGLAPDFHVYMLDMRNHGQSFHSITFDYPSMVNDLDHFMQEKGIDKSYLMGHSMGGKIAMNFAVNHPDTLLKLIIVDISPRSYPIHHDNILTGLSSIDLSALQSRSEADEQLSKYVAEKSTRNFLLKNLARDENNNFMWRLNLPVIRMNIERVGVGLPGNNKFEGETLFIKGSNSNYILEEDFDLIKERFPNSTIKIVEGAGHWVHAEQPEKFLETVKEFLST